jgi:diguanylate cyclase (GGDEF)-like protein
MEFNKALFDKEESVISEGEVLLRDGKAENVPTPTYAGLLKGYKKLFVQTKRLVRLGDSQQNELKRVTVELTEKTNLLTATLDSLNQEIERRKILENELRHRASTDVLTGVYSRRSILELGELEIKRMERNDARLVVLMLDIDHFKAINDNYGHNAGDEALRVFSRVCQNNLREIDLFGRLGGEEFVAIMPGTGQDDALAVARRICNKVAETEIPHGSSTLKITVSIGLAEANRDESSFDAVLAQADKALYAAKNNGRNRIEVH